MDFISSIISKELVYALGWTVVHSLWQAVGVAFIMAGVLLALQKHSSNLRYRLTCGALLVVLALAVFTFFDLYQFARHKNVIEITQLALAPSADATPVLAETQVIPTLLERITSYFNDHLPLIVSVWLLGLSLFMIRLIGGLAYLDHLKTNYTYPLESHWEDMLEYLAEQLPIKRTVELMESALVQVPIVVGHFKPIILMPVGAVNGLTVEQVEAILAHELAHIARNDYILNVVQSVIEALFYFNPAVWWISANIRTERENCCDDVAIQLCKNKLTYAKALVAIQEMNQAAPNLAMAFGKRKGQFLNRIRRILNQSQNQSDMIEKITATGLLLAVLLGLTVSATQPDYDKLSVVEAPDLAVIEDTLPQKGTMNFTGRYNGQDVKTTVKNGKITYLKIDGKEIAQTAYKDYEPLVEEIMENVPPPPPPPPVPMPPMPGIPSAPPVPSAPPAGNWEWQADAERQLQELQFLEESMNNNLANHQRLIELQEKELNALSERLLQEQNGEIASHTKILKEELARLRNEEMRLREEHRENTTTTHKREMERFALERQKFEEERLAWEKRNREVRTRFEQELINDRFIKSGARFHLTLNGKEMTVNGVKVSDTIAKKYRTIYKELWGKDFCEDCNFSINTGGKEE